MPMNETTPSSKRFGFFHRLTLAYVGFSHRRPWIPLLVIALTAYAGIHVAEGLRIDTDLRVLLPQGNALQRSDPRSGASQGFHRFLYHRHRSAFHRGTGSPAKGNRGLVAQMAGSRMGAIRPGSIFVREPRPPVFAHLGAGGSPRSRARHDWIKVRLGESSH